MRFMGKKFGPLLMLMVLLDSVLGQPETADIKAPNDNALPVIMPPSLSQKVMFLLFFSCIVWTFSWELTSFLSNRSSPSTNKSSSSEEGSYTKTDEKSTEVIFLHEIKELKDETSNEKIDSIENSKTSIDEEEDKKKKLLEQLSTPVQREENPSQNQDSGWFLRLSQFTSYTEETQKVARASTLFGLILFVFYLADGEHGLPLSGSNREYDRDLFLFICLVITIMGFLMLRDTHKKNDSILNREQTEEWKGFMQIGFVLYHYFAAKETYNLIRIFIAAYVWMTGFGNFSYFWIRKDYSFVRLVKMMIRLNWLVFFVCLVLDKEYMLYYVCPLHSFFFMVVYLTMLIFNQKNYDPFFMKVKFLVSLLFLVILYEVPGVFDVFFSPFYFIMKYQGSLHEWHFRSGLDRYAAWLGMLYAYNYPIIEKWLKQLEASVPWKHYLIKFSIAAICLIGSYLWLSEYFFMDKFDYNKIHPYVSIIPITFYIILRNLGFRSKVLGLFQWSGRITLETYIAQFHIWLMDDAKTRIVYLPGYPLINFAIASTFYLFVSVCLFETTTVMNDALIPPGVGNSFLLKRFLAISSVLVASYSLVYFMGLFA